MSSTEKFVLLALARFADSDGGSIYPTMARIAADCRMTDRSVRTAMRGLEGAGIIRMVRAEDAARHRPREYKIETSRLNRAENTSPPEKSSAIVLCSSNKSIHGSNRKPPVIGLPVDLLSPETQDRLSAVRDLFGRHPTKPQAHAIAAADPGIVHDAVERVKERGLSRYGVKWFVDSMERLAAEQREQAATAPPTAGPVLIDGATGNVITTPRPARAATGRAAMGQAIRKRMQ